MNALKDRARLITAALEELDAVFVPEIPVWFFESATRKISNIRRIFETELTRLDSRLEAAIARNADARNANAPLLSPADVDSLRTEIQYIMNDVHILEGKTEFTQEDFAVNDAGLVHLLLANPRIDPAVNDNAAIKEASEEGYTEVVRLHRSAMLAVSSVFQQNN